MFFWRFQRFRFFLLFFFWFFLPWHPTNVPQQHPVGQEVCKKAVSRNGTLDTSCPWLLGWLLVGRCWRGWSCCVGGQFSVIFFFGFCCSGRSRVVSSVLFLLCLFGLSAILVISVCASDKKKDFFLGSCFLLSLVHPFFLLYYLYLRLLSLCFLYLRFVFFFVPRCLFIIFVLSFYPVIYHVISLFVAYQLSSAPLLWSCRGYWHVVW